ncbi:MAG: preprotein translocase subunit YajC [Lachnospiraceae bacterium]|nr:preprotein translocase subunit YajC [Lachnospiraceae bacterium]
MLLSSALATASSTAAGASSVSLIVWIVVLFVFMYFFMIRPQQKETKKKNEMMASMAVGDTVLTTSGFYGVIIDIQEDTVIVEFGSNKNCRIPMQMAAIAEIEKPEDAQ